jgi:superfamily II DNA or RNA helicase
MSGTFERGDGDRIAFIDYEATGSAWIPNFDKPDMAYIQYTRSDALAEKAILPTKFFTHDGHAKWKDKNGEIRQTNSLAKTYGYDIAPAIYTALETDFANELMDKTLAHWSNYRQSNPRSKLLVVCAGIEGARRMLEHLKNNGVNAKIATSHESANAHENIRQFKDGWIDAIVTIAMAYEGLDVPEITHTACLTHIRSKPWLEQMLARGVRVDRNAGVYETQCAYVFAPDDVLFREVMNKIKEDQEPYAKRQPKQQGLFGEELAEGDGTKSFGFTPLGSGLTGHREAFFGSGQQPHIEQPIETPDELEARLRDEMENHVRVYSFQNRLHPAEINTEIKKQFGIKRSEMTSAQLEKALDFIKMKWPKNHRRGTLNKRVPNRAVETGGRECNRWEL